VVIVSRIIHVKVDRRLNVTNKFKYQRRLSNRLAIVMFRGTPCSYHPDFKVLLYYYILIKVSCRSMPNAHVFLSAVFARNSHQFFPRNLSNNGGGGGKTRPTNSYPASKPHIG